MADNLQVLDEYFIVPAHVYDLFTSGTTWDVNVTAWAGEAAALNDDKPDVSVGKIQDGMITGDALADSGSEDIADKVWDEATAGHTGADTFGAQCATDIDAILTDTAAATPALIADAVWNEESTGHTTAGYAGAQLWTDIDAILEDTDSSLDTIIGRIEADTQDLQNRLPAALVSGRMSSDVVALSGDTAAADYLELIAEQARGVTISATGGTGGSDADDIVDSVWDELTASHTDAGSAGKEIGDAYDVICGALSALSDATDTGATPTLAQAIMLLYEFKKNNVEVTSTSRRLRNAADDANVMTATMSDNGTTFEQGLLS